MAHSEMKNIPPLHGWAIGIAAGAVATGVSFIVVGIEANGSVAIGAVLALVVGGIFTWAEAPKPAIKPGSGATRADEASAAASVAEMTAAAAQITTAPTTAPTTALAPEPGMSAPADEEGKPAALSAPQGTADDLKQINGVGPVLESKLNDLGIYHFWQIAGWSPAEVEWVDGFLNFKGRITRDDWVSQASRLAQTSPTKPPAT